MTKQTMTIVPRAKRIPIAPPTPKTMPKMAPIPNPLLMENTTRFVLLGVIVIVVIAVVIVSKEDVPDQMRRQHENIRTVHDKAEVVTGFEKITWKHIS